MTVLTEIQTKILEALAKYRFLTHSQMLRLRIGSPSFLRFSTRRLREKGDKPLIASIRYPFVPSEGKLEQVHHLTPTGAAVLADFTKNEAFKTNFRPITAVYHRDYWHRKFTIDFQIALMQVMEEHDRLEIQDFDRYFDKTGANRSTDGKTLRSSTRIDLSDGQHLIPDANVVITRLFDQVQPFLCCVEIANGRDCKRVLRQIERHAQALEEKGLAKSYGLETKLPHQILFIFTDYGLLKAVRTRFVEIETALPFSACFRFGLFDNLMQDVLRCWQMPSHVGDEWFHLITGKPIQCESDETSIS